MLRNARLSLGPRVMQLSRFNFKEATGPTAIRCKLVQSEGVKLAQRSMRALLVVQRPRTKSCQHTANWSHRHKGWGAVVQSKNYERRDRRSGGERYGVKRRSRHGWTRSPASSGGHV